MVAAFATAPVTNPDGTAGINLHLDAGRTCPSRSYALGDSPTFSIPGNPPCPNVGELLNYGGTHFSDARVGSFRLANVGDGCGASHGVAQQPGVNSAVQTGGGDFAHVFMHELGHNLNLSHSCCGSPGTNEFQPNRFSVMNARLHVSDTGSGSTEVPDYQRVPTPSLDENNLNETAGMGLSSVYSRHYVNYYCGTLRNAWLGYGGSIDWDCDSPLGPPPPTFEDPGTPSLDVNGRWPDHGAPRRGQRVVDARLHRRRARSASWSRKAQEEVELNA